MNKLKKLREEFGLSVRKLSDLVKINHMSLNYYENESRTISPKTLIILAEFYDVTVDYILGKDDSFIYVTYEKTLKKYIIRETLFNYLKKENYIYYKSNKRYIDLNKIFNIDNVFDVSFLIDAIYYSQDFKKLFNVKELSDDDIKKILHPDIIEINAYMLNKIIEKLNDN